MMKKGIFTFCVLIFCFSFSCLGITFPTAPDPGYTPIRYTVGEAQSFGLVIPIGWDSVQLIFNPDQIQIDIVEIRGAKTWSANYYYGKNEMGIAIGWPSNTSLLLVDLRIKLLKTGLASLWYGHGMHNCGDNTFFWFIGLPTAKGAGAPAKNPGMGGKQATTWGKIKANN